MYESFNSTLKAIIGSLLVLSPISFPLFYEDTNKFNLKNLRDNPELILFVDNCFKNSLVKIFNDLSGKYGSYQVTIKKDSYDIHLGVQRLPQSPWDVEGTRTVSLEVISSTKTLESLEKIIDRYLNNSSIRLYKFKDKTIIGNLLSYTAIIEDPSVLYDFVNLLEEIAPEYKDVIEKKFVPKASKMLSESYEVKYRILTWDEFVDKYKSSERENLNILGNFYPLFEITARGKDIEEDVIGLTNIESAKTSLLPLEVMEIKEFKEKLSKINNSLDALIFAVNLTNEIIDYNHQFLRAYEDVEKSKNNLILPDNVKKEIWKRYEEIYRKEYDVRLSKIISMNRGVCHHYALLTRAIYGAICSYKGFSDLIVEYVCSNTLNHAWVAVAFKDKSGTAYVTFIDPTWADEGNRTDWNSINAVDSRHFVGRVPITSYNKTGRDSIFIPLEYTGMYLPEASTVREFIREIDSRCSLWETTKRCTEAIKDFVRPYLRYIKDAYITSIKRCFSKT